MSKFHIKGKKIGILSDIHLGLGQDSKQWHDVALDFANWAADTFIDKGINDIVIPGDVFHNRTEINVNTIAVAKIFFDHFKDFRIFISSGNHDSFYKDKSTINSISILDGWNNIHVIDQHPITIKTDYEDIVLVPWGTKFEDIPETKGIIFGHFEISSFYMNSYKVCEHGIESKDLLTKAPYIISGHFHKRDHRKYKNGNILYVGSCFQHNFGDAGDDRGIYVFDLSDNSFEFIENNISPKHYKISVKELKKNKEKYNDVIEKNIVSIVVDEKIDQDELLSLTTSVFKDKKPLAYRTDYVNEDEIKLNDEDKNIDSGNILKDIEEFVENLDVEYKKEIIEYLTETYKLLTNE